MFKENASQFVENSSIGIHTVSSDGIIQYANQCELDTLGYSHDEYVGHHVSEFQLDQVILDDMMCKLEDFEILKNYPSKVKGKNGLKYILYNSSVYSENGKFVHTRCYGSELDEATYELFKTKLG